MKLSKFKNFFEKKNTLPKDEEFISSILLMNERQRIGIEYKRFKRKIKENLKKYKGVPTELSRDNLNKYWESIKYSANEIDFINEFLVYPPQFIDNIFGIHMVLRLYKNTRNPIQEGDYKSYIIENTPLDLRKFNLFKKTHSYNKIINNSFSHIGVLSGYRLVKERDEFIKSQNLEQLLRKYYKGKNPKKLKVENYNIDSYTFENKQYHCIGELKSERNKYTTKFFDIYLDGAVGIVISYDGHPLYELSLTTDEQGRLLIKQHQQTFYTAHNTKGNPINKFGKEINKGTKDDKIVKKYHRAGNKIFFPQLCIEIARTYAAHIGSKYYGIQSAENNEYTKQGDSVFFSMDSAKKIYDLFAQENGFVLDPVSKNYFKSNALSSHENETIKK